MFKQTLQQKLGMKINPLQVQLIRLLELPTHQLEQRIKEELEQNPLLEEGEGVANRILMGMNIDIDFLYEKISYYLFFLFNYLIFLPELFLMLFLLCF